MSICTSEVMQKNMVLQWIWQRKIWILVFGMVLFALVKEELYRYGDTASQYRKVFAPEGTFEENSSMLTPPVTLHPVCPVDFLSKPLMMLDTNCANYRNCRNITCRDLLFSNNSDKSADKLMYDKVRAYMKKHPKVVISESVYINMTHDCDKFKSSMGYILTPMNNEEAEFPIAYNILMHRDLEQVERLLRSIYRPQNSYCIHIDLNTPEIMQQAIQSIANCFPNVFLPSKREHIVYAGMTRLQADINCMRDHLAKKVQWKYLLNLAGQSFPLKTNHELVQILKIYNGSNDIEGIFGHRVLKGRFVNEWVELARKMNKTGRQNPKPPHDIDIVRGSAYGVFSYDFVHYIINDPWAKDLLEWSRKTWSPDEHYWATLHHTYSNPHMKPPGSYPCENYL